MMQRQENSWNVHGFSMQSIKWKGVEMSRGESKIAMVMDWSNESAAGVGWRGIPNETTNWSWHKYDY